MKIVAPSEESSVEGKNDESTLEDIFQIMKEKTLKAYYNSMFWQPYYHCISGSIMCLEDPRWNSTDKHRSLFNATFNDFLSFTKQLLSSLKAEVLIHGNITINEATELSDMIVTTINHQPLASSQVCQLFTCSF